MTPLELVTLPYAERELAVTDAETSLLREALTIAKRQGFASAAADIAYEIGRRASEGEKWDE